MRALNKNDHAAANIYADRNPADPFARDRALLRLSHNNATPADLVAGRLDNYPPPDEQYIVKELEKAEERAQRERRK